MRLAQMVITLLGVSFLTFSLTFIAPGDPVDAILETGDTIVSQETIERTRHELGLDLPFHEQYIRWLNGVVHGDMGMSYSAKMPVQEKLLQNLPGTLLLAGTAVIMMLLISIPAGVVSALYRNRWPDQVIRVFTFLGVSMPSFWVGLILLYVFGLKLGLFPIAGGEVSLDRLILPAFTLAILLSSKYTRQVRTAVLVGAIVGPQSILWEEIFSPEQLDELAQHGLTRLVDDNPNSREWNVLSKETLADFSMQDPQRTLADLPWPVLMVHGVLSNELPDTAEATAEGFPLLPDSSQMVHVHAETLEQAQEEVARLSVEWAQRRLR